MDSEGQSEFLAWVLFALLQAQSMATLMAYWWILTYAGPFYLVAIHPTSLIF